MKQLLKFFVTGVLATSIITGNAFAQQASINNSSKDIAFNNSDNANHAPEAVKSTNEKKDKKMLKATMRAEKASLRATNNLSKNFKDASNVVWSHESNAIVARFKIDGQKSVRVVYTKGGGWSYTIITYYEAQLPRDVHSIVKANYPDFTITLVQEIIQSNVPLYKVYLEDCSSLKQVLVYDGELTVYADFKKSK